MSLVWRIALNVSDIFSNNKRGVLTIFVASITKVVELFAGIKILNEDSCMNLTLGFVETRTLSKF